MDLFTLLEEIRYGEKAVNENNDIDNITENIDGDYNIFLTSQRISSLVEGFDMDMKTRNVSKRLISKFEEFEKRVLSEEKISDIYKKMKSDSLTKDLNIFVNQLEENTKTYNDLDKDIAGKILAAAQYGVENIVENSEYSAKDLSVSKPVLESVYLEEYNKLVDVIG